MAFEVEWPADIWLQLLICVGFVAVTLVLARIDLLRTVVIHAGAAMLQATRLAAAGVIWLFDKVMPVDGRNGRLPRANFGVWVLLNTAVVAAWIVTSQVTTGAPYALAAAGAAAVFVVLNLLLLGASYWAVRETIEVTNGELPAGEARFAEASPARNVVFVLGTAMLLVLQIAVIVDWVQQARAVALVATDGAIGPRYLNFLLATVDALPLAAFYVAPLSRHAWFAGDLPALALSRSLNGLGSILIVSTAFGLIQQRLAFQRMVEALVDSKDTLFPAALLARFKNAPSAIKGYVMHAFRTETDDERRLKLALLAVARCTYSFPQVFAANYPSLSERVRAEGSAIVADFIADKTVTFYPTTLQNFFDACDQAQRRGGFKAIAERRRMARAYIAALERLVELDPAAADARIRTILAQKILIAAVRTRSSYRLSEHAAELLARINSYEAIAPLLQAVAWFPDAIALTVLARITRTLGDKGIIFPPKRNLELLKRMAAAGRSAHTVLLSPEAALSLDRAMEKLDARLTAVTAQIERQRRKRERAAARRGRSATRPRSAAKAVAPSSAGRPAPKPMARAGARTVSAIREVPSVIAAAAPGVPMLPPPAVAPHGTEAVNSPAAH